MIKSKAYNGFSSTAVVGLLQGRQQEVIEIELPLKGDFVVGVENVERERGLWLLEGRGVPTHSQKLAVPLDPFGILCTFTELDVDVVRSVDVDDKNNLRLRARRRTSSMLVTDVEGMA